MERVRSICLQRTAPVARMYTYPVEYVCVSKSYPHTLPPTPQINPELRGIRPGNGLRWTRRRGAAPRTSSSTSQRIDPRRTGPPGHRIGFRAPSPYIGHVGDVMLSLVLTGCWLKGWEAGCLDCLSRKRKLRESKLLGSRILWTIAWCSWVTNMCVQRHMSVTALLQRNHFRCQSWNFARGLYCWLEGWEVGFLDCLPRKKMRESKLLGSRILYTIAWCSSVTNTCTTAEEPLPLPMLELC